MEIVKLAYRGEARLQHQHVSERSDRLHVIRRQPVKEAIHDLAPGPKAVSVWAAALCEPSHATLERMAMEVGKTRNGDTGYAFGTFARCTFCDRKDSAVRDTDPYVARPARR